LSATVVTPDLLPFAEQHNRATRREGAETALAFEHGRMLNVPLIAGAKWSYECKVFKAVPVGDCITFFSDFRHVNVRADVQALDFYNLRAINPVIYSPFNYFTVGEHIGAIGDYSKG
jgi:flavin reductase (DIM6/NTAB) family NADH-FMN oxidoreductase RutF